MKDFNELAGKAVGAAKATLTTVKNAISIEKPAIVTNPKVQAVINKLRGK